MHAPFVIALIAIGLGVLLIIVAFDLLTISFERLGISPWATFLIFAASAIGSLINIPVWASHPQLEPGRFFRVHRQFFFVPPHVTNNQIVAINVGGALIPVLLSLWLLPKAPLLRTVIATAVVAVVAHISATIVPGRGITMPLLLGPIVAAVAALVLTGGRRAAPVAYIAGSIGILIGADLSNLGRMSELGSGVLSIGGAGVFDGVFLTGLIAALLSFDTSSKAKTSPPVGLPR